MSEEIKPGSFVTTIYPDEPEVGIVIAMWSDGGPVDCYVAFYGEKWPKMIQSEHPEKPYILRYYANSLRVVEPEWRK